jgi:hypothetical protein
LGKELFSRLHDLFFRGKVRCCRWFFSRGTAFFWCRAFAGSRLFFGCCRA